MIWDSNTAQSKRNKELIVDEVSLIKPVNRKPPFMVRYLSITKSTKGIKFLQSSED